MKSRRWGNFYTDLLIDFTVTISSHIGDDDSLRSITESKVDSPPINDIGSLELWWKISAVSGRSLSEMIL